MWLLGRIVQVLPGRDGVARVADIKTKKGVIRRAFNNICPLPILTVEEPSSSTPGVCWRQCRPSNIPYTAHGAAKVPLPSDNDAPASGERPARDTLPCAPYSAWHDHLYAPRPATIVILVYLIFIISSVYSPLVFSFSLDIPLSRTRALDATYGP
jgi:hypothetical protein